MTIDTHHADHAPSHRPLGFWLDAVDRLLRRDFAAALAEDGIDRADWRMLNALAGDVDAPGLAGRILRKPQRVLALADRGWIAPAGSGWELTAEGRAAKERIGEKTARIRERVANAVPPEDFATMLASLEAIARELGWEEGEPLPRRRRPGDRRKAGHRLGRRHHAFEDASPWLPRRFLGRAHAHRVAHGAPWSHDDTSADDRCGGHAEFRPYPRFGHGGHDGHGRPHRGGGFPHPRPGEQFPHPERPADGHGAEAHSERDPEAR